MIYSQFFAMAAQLKRTRVSGNGATTMSNTVKCVIPSAKVGGAAKQEMYKGINLFDSSIITDNQLEDFQGYGRSLTSYDDVNAILEPNTSYTISYDVVGLADVPDNFSKINNPIVGITLQAAAGSGLSNISLGLNSATFNRWILKGEKIRIVASFTTLDVVNYRIIAYSQRATDTDSNNSIYNRIAFVDVMLVKGEYTEATFPEYEIYSGGIPYPKRFPVFLEPAVSDGESTVLCPVLRATLDGNVHDIYDVQNDTMYEYLASINLHNCPIEISGTDAIFMNALEHDMNCANGICTCASVGDGMVIGKNDRNVYWRHALDISRCKSAQELGQWLDERKDKLWVARQVPIEYHIESSDRLIQHNGITTITSSDNAPLEITYITV